MSLRVAHDTTRNDMENSGARGGRTLKVFPPEDFKSSASADSAIAPAGPIVTQIFDGSSGLICYSPIPDYEWKIKQKTSDNANQFHKDDVVGPGREKVKQAGRGWFGIDI